MRCNCNCFPYSNNCEATQESLRPWWGSDRMEGISCWLPEHAHSVQCSFWECWEKCEGTGWNVSSLFERTWVQLLLPWWDAVCLWYRRQAVKPACQPQAQAVQHHRQGQSCSAQNGESWWVLDGQRYYCSHSCFCAQPEPWFLALFCHQEALQEWHSSTFFPFSSLAPCFKLVVQL